jgi:hypothetical protein
MSFDLTMPSLQAFLAREGAHSIEPAVIGDEGALDAAISQSFGGARIASSPKRVITQTGMNGGDNRRRSW